MPEQSNEKVKRWKVCEDCDALASPYPEPDRCPHCRGPVVEVIPVDSPCVLSEEEARLWIRGFDFLLSDEEMALAKEVARRLADFAKEGSDRE